MSERGRPPAVGPRLVAAMDKFRSTAEAAEAARAVMSAWPTPASAEAIPLSDGGEGFRRVFDGEVLTVAVRDPWGQLHEAPLTRLAGDGRQGVLEVAEIIGRSHRVQASAREALAASSAGVADALVAAAEIGCERVVLGCGGSATSDGGWGCYEALVEGGGLPLEVVCATDITATFLGALRYAEQKGVASSDLGELETRLRECAARYQRRGGIDVLQRERAGAAGGLSGALWALGARLVGGFDEVARATSLGVRLAEATHVVTGEGRLDAGSLEGKVVAGVCALTTPSQRVLVLCGAADPTAAAALRERHPWVEVRDLVSAVGEERARHDTLAALAEVAAEVFATP